MSTTISRRTFIKGAAAAGVALAAGSYFTWNGQNIPNAVKKGEVTYDVLIIGSGGAGMRAALAAAENKDLKVAVMTKLIPTRSASTMAQGGMNGVTGVTDPADTVESHMFDTIKGGDYLCDQDAVEYFAQRAGENIYEMDFMGYPYNRQKDGAFHQRKMGGSSHPRAAYFEDRAGHAMVHALFEQCLKNNIDFISECQMLEISMDGDKLNGVIAMDMRSGNLLGVAAKTVIIATGGYGRVYWIRTSNPYSSTGDGIVAGMNIGIPFKDPEMVQFHPTGLSANGVLLSESSRAEGALLINKDGERFMGKYAPEKKELATRDIVARAIATEMLEGRGVGEGIHAGVYMDFRHIPPERIDERLGQVWDLSKRFAGVDIKKEMVPIAPTCHYSMGGLEMADFHTGALPDGFCKIGFGRLHGRFKSFALAQKCGNGRRQGAACSVKIPRLYFRIREARQMSVCEKHIAHLAALQMTALHQHTRMMFLGQLHRRRFHLFDSAHFSIHQQAHLVQIGGYQRAEREEFLLDDVHGLLGHQAAAGGGNHHGVIDHEARLARTMSGSLTIPIFTASTDKSVITESIWVMTISGVTGRTPCTPIVF